MYKNSVKIEIYITNYGDFNIRIFKNKIINLLDDAMNEEKTLLYSVNEVDK